MPGKSTSEAEPGMFAVETQSCQCLAEGKVTDKVIPQPSEYFTIRTSLASTSSCSNFRMSTHLLQAISRSPNDSSSHSTALVIGTTNLHEASTPSTFATSSLAAEPPSQICRASSCTQTAQCYHVRPSSTSSRTATTRQASSRPSTSRR